MGDGAIIGDDVVLDAHVTIYPRCVVGARTLIHTGAVIGADGFGWPRRRAAGIKIPQIGRVVVGADVEIGANTTIDRGAIDDTVIEDDVKLDNQIQIGHNCRHRRAYCDRRMRRHRGHRRTSGAAAGSAARR